MPAEVGEGASRRAASEEGVTGRRYLEMRELEEQRRQEQEAEGVALMERSSIE